MAVNQSYRRRLALRVRPAYDCVGVYVDGLLKLKWLQ